MKKILLVLVTCICVMFAFTACGGNAAVEKELESQSWYVDKQDKNAHTLSYEYTFKDGKVTIKYNDITEITSVGPLYITDEAVKGKKVGTYDYSVSGDDVVIKSDSEEEIPFTYEDEVLVLDGGKFFTLEQVKTNLRGKWSSVDSFSFVSFKNSITFKEDGTSEFATENTGIGNFSYNTYPGEYTIGNGYVKNTETDDNVNKFYCYTFDGKTLSIEGYDREN